MKKILLQVVCSHCIPFPYQRSRGNDATTKPDLYYLKNEQTIDSLKLLPPPPEVGSIQFLNDQAMHEKPGYYVIRNAENKLILMPIWLTAV